MYNLYLKNKQNKLITAVEKPFKTEAEFEKYLSDTKEIFSDIFILKRQVNAGKEIPDMVGIDKDNNVVIIELKNIAVNETILPQILRYAIWAKKNPDSIRALWLESKDRPEDIEIDWDNVEIRVIVLAPTIKLSVLSFLKEINYNIELIEVRRFLIGDEESILLNKLEEEPEMKARSVRGLEIYDKEFHKSCRNNKSVDAFFRVIEEIEEIIKKKDWNLEKRLNKGYVSFKIGSRIVFGIEWLGTKSFGLFFKVSSLEYKKIKKASSYEMEYDQRWKQAGMKYDDNIKINKLEKVFEMTYDFFVEK
ncbi:hypothetical protein KAU40_01195 [Candidatus Parcubacteria bacterium]|nr:hypothetical protein [Candidatus Parcubacteria bacterium]